MNDLPHWKQWCQNVKNGDITKNAKAAVPGINRARARYRLACGFDGVRVSGISDRTAKGYDAALKLLLVYSAAECLGSAIRKPVTEWEISDHELANRLRKVLSHAVENEGEDQNVQIEKPIAETLTKEATRQKFRSFIGGETDDVRIAATVLRILMAHGNLTVGGLDMELASNRKAVMDLSYKLLDTAGAVFESWLGTEVLI